MRRFSLPSQPDHASKEAASAKRRYILLIEDNPADVGLVCEALEEHAVHCEVTIINDGERAIQFLDSLESETVQYPELIILDLRLPKFSGREVLKHLQANLRYQHIPVVILTSSDSERDRLETERLGATRYIQKPNRLSDYLELGNTFKELLNRFPC